VKLAVVVFLASGTKRSLSVLRSRSALVVETAPTLVQLEPPLVEYCQVPLPLTRLVTAMPDAAPLSTSADRGAEHAGDGLAAVAGVVFGDAGEAGRRRR
jgi:hypothetical protein